MRGCEPTPKGRQKDANHELAEARQQCRKLAAEVQRYQALARATQRRSDWRRHRRHPRRASLASAP